MRLISVFFTALCAFGAGPFLAEPYLQLGTGPKSGMAILWHAEDRDADFQVRTRPSDSSKWSKPVAASWQRIGVKSVEPHRVWSVSLVTLPAGREFDYEVLLAGKPVFAARAMSRKGPKQSARIAVWGDCGQNSPEQKQIAYQASLQKPDMVFITGDIVYGKGRVTEYREKHFPVYNAAEASPRTGAPLLRSVLFTASTGNHDIAEKDFTKYPDTQAYYYYWKQPLNGPLGEPGPFTSKLEGDKEAIEAFQKAAGPNYPRMANFSFDYGDTHWTVLDGNPYVDWTDKALWEWVARDLEAAARKPWRFVGFHHPGFNSSKAHFREQQMRVLAPLFERYNVQVVFTGHVHNYQRSYPMTYDPASGKWKLHRDYDEKTGKPQGVTYLVTGAGGARLYNPEQQDDPKSWQEFTKVFISKVNTLTVMDVSASEAVIRQVDVDGKEVDRFAIKR